MEQASSTKASSFKASSCWSFKLQASTAWSQKIFSQLPHTLILYNGNNSCQCDRPSWKTNTFGQPRMQCVQQLLKWDAKKLPKLKNPNQAQNLGTHQTVSGTDQQLSQILFCTSQKLHFDKFTSQLVSTHCRVAKTYFKKCQVSLTKSRS